MQLPKWTIVSAFVATTLVACAPPSVEDDDAAEETGESDNALLAGSPITPSEVATHLRNAGFPENLVGKFTCIAKWESTYYPRARNGSHYGLWQISRMHLNEVDGCPSTINALYNPATNARCALGVYNLQGLGAWTAYRAHRTECNSFRAPASTNVSDTPDDVSATPTEPAGSSQSQEDATGGSCWSGTNQKVVEEDWCVQSGAASARGVWMQCKDGKWYRGGDDTTGRFGTCAGAIPLSQ